MFLVDEIKLLLKLLKFIKKHPVLLLPDLAMMFLTVFIALLFLYISGLIDVILVNPFIISGNTELGNITSFIISYFENANNFIKLLIGFLVFVVTHFFLGSSIISTKFVMMKKIVRKEKVKLVRSFFEGGKYYWEVIFLRILVFTLTFFIPFLIGLNLFSNKFFLSVVLIVSLMINGVFGLVLLFRYPILFLDNEKAIDTIKKSFTMFRNKFNLILLAAFIIVLLGILTNLIMLGVNYLLPGIVDWIKNMTNGYMGLWGVAILVVTIAYFIRTVFGLFISLWGDLYLFWKYNAKR